ncbi:MAG: magnesium transporter [Alphaproteobacteria bacterium]|mgnify:FL=1|jgi:magnesium transporter|nr:magnesium transporter [Alphaproteobacteria bacterium]MBT4083051.1 magnesium transporter [Alphaproteobacteria bacterium]MBT4542487.1 magnesium transporter [Alphaproteobacteria bacterium]MBT7746546.1 magnesium transporter [Alphaproteobacteria bacterium]
MSSVQPPDLDVDYSSQEVTEEQLGLTHERVVAITDALDDGNIELVNELVDYLHTADIADLMEQITPDHRHLLIDATRGLLDPEYLVDLEEDVLDDVVDQLGTAEVAAAVAELDIDDAVDVIEDLDEDEQREVLRAVPEEERGHIEQALSYPEDSAGRLMQRDLIAVPAFWSIGQMIDYLRDSEDLPEDFYEIFVVDPGHRPIGSIPLNKAMRTKRPVILSEVMENEPVFIQVETDQEDVAFQFQQYDLTSAPVIDASGRLVGVIMHDDVVDVIHEEAEEDIMHLAGLSEGNIYSTVLNTSKRRFSWLLINLLTAVLASVVIAQFDAAIEEIVALAILMPIVASMGGNAGTQTMTVAVRALATRELTETNARRFVNKELLVGVANGVVFAILAGLLAGGWFQDAALGAVIAAAMVINMIVAGLGGVLVPLGFGRLGIDPAIAASVFVTTITDVIGFLAFLSLAATFLI